MEITEKITYYPYYLPRSPARGSRVKVCDGLVFDVQTTQPLVWTCPRPPETHRASSLGHPITNRRRFRVGQTTRDQTDEALGSDHPRPNRRSSRVRPPETKPTKLSGQTTRDQTDKALGSDHPRPNRQSSRVRPPETKPTKLSGQTTRDQTDEALGSDHPRPN